MGVWLSYPIADFTSSVASIILIKRAFGRLNGAVEKEETREKYGLGDVGKDMI